MGKLILKAAVILFGTIMLSGCLTVKRIERNCDAFAKICIDKNSQVIYRDTVIYIRDTIHVPLPRDTVFITDTLIVVDGKIHLNPIYARFGIVAAEAKIINNRLSVLAWIADSTLLYPRIDTIYLDNAITERTNPVVVKEPFVPPFYYFTFYGFFMLLLILTLTVAFLRYRS